MAAISSGSSDTIDLFWLCGCVVKHRPTDLMPANAGLYTKWLYRAMSSWKNDTEEEFCKKYAGPLESDNISTSAMRITIGNLIMMAKSFFPNTNVQKMDALREALICRNVKALSFALTSSPEEQQLYYIRKSLNWSIREARGFIRPHPKFENHEWTMDRSEPEIIVGEMRSDATIFSNDCIESSVDSLPNIDQDTKTAIKRILSSFLEDSSSSKIGISYMDLKGEEQLKIWEKLAGA